jgi:hypothetical protein
MRPERLENSRIAFRDREFDKIEWMLAIAPASPPPEPSMALAILDSGSWRVRVASMDGKRQSLRARHIYAIHRTPVTSIARKSKSVVFAFLRRQIADAMFAAGPIHGPYLRHARIASKEGKQHKIEWMLAIAPASPPPEPSMALAILDSDSWRARIASMDGKRHSRRALL